MISVPAATMWKRRGTRDVLKVFCRSGLQCTCPQFSLAGHEPSRVLLEDMNRYDDTHTHAACLTCRVVV